MHSNGFVGKWYTFIFANFVNMMSYHSIGKIFKIDDKFYAPHNIIIQITEFRMHTLVKGCIKTVNYDDHPEKAVLAVLLRLMHQRTLFIYRMHDCP